MKKLFFFPLLLIGLSACNNTSAEKEAEIETAHAAAIDTLENLRERIRLEDSLEAVSETTVAPEPSPTAKRKPARNTAPATTEEKSGTASTEKEEPAPAASSTPVTADDPAEKTASAEEPAEPTATEEKKKKGVSNTVKGAVIGAGAGAVGGAIINKKNPGKGAIIGGVVGAGAGAVTGVILDKNKKKKEAKDTTEKKEQ